MSGADVADPAAPVKDVPLLAGQPAFVAPRTYLDQARPMVPLPLSAIDREQLEGLRTIRAFLKVRTSYDVMPLSFRLIVLDTSLLVKKSLNILMQNGGTSLFILADWLLTWYSRHCLSTAVGL